MRIIGALIAMTGGLAAVFGAILPGLVGRQARNRLDGLPRALLHLAARRLPSEVREDRLAEWVGELYEFLSGGEARAATRLLRGTRYAVGLLHVAPTISRAITNIAQGTHLSRSVAACIVGNRWRRTTRNPVGEYPVASRDVYDHVRHLMIFEGRDNWHKVPWSVLKI